MCADRPLATVLACVVLSAASAAASTPSLEVSAPTVEVRVGDRVPVRVVARGGEELLWGEVEIAVEGDGPWAVVDGPREVPGVRPPAWEVVLAPMELGELPLPPIRANVRDPGGEARAVEAAGLPQVTVVSVLPGEGEVDPAPMRDPIGVGGFPWEWVLPLAIPVLGAFAGLLWWRKRRGSLGDALPAVVLTPIDELMSLLDRLEVRVGNEPAESICDRLAGGLRHYLERTSGKPAGEMTSFELRLLARGEEWPDAVQRGIQTVMRTADRVRFGRLGTDESELRRAIEAGRVASRSLEEHVAAVTQARAEMEAAG